METAAKKSIIVVVLFLLAFASVNALTDIEKKRMQMIIDRSEDKEDLEKFASLISESNLSLEEQAPEVMEKLEQKAQEVGADVEVLFGKKPEQKIEVIMPEMPVQKPEDKKLDYIFMSVFLAIFLAIIITILYRKEEYIKKQTERINKLESYISAASRKGYASSQLRQSLIDKGWNEHEIDTAFDAFLKARK